MYSLTARFVPGISGRIEARLARSDSGLVRMRMKRHCRLMNSERDACFAEQLKMKFRLGRHFTASATSVNVSTAGQNTQQQMGLPGEGIKFKIVKRSTL